MKPDKEKILTKNAGRCVFSVQLVEKKREDSLIKKKKAVHIVTVRYMPSNF